MLRLTALTLTCLIALGTGARGQEALSDPFPEDFGPEAMARVTFLVEYGPRTAGTPAEREVALWVRDQLDTLGLEAWLEPFAFESFVIEEVTLSACGKEVVPALVGINPYEDELVFEAEAVFVGPDVSGGDLAGLGLEDRLVVTTDPVPYFTLMFGRPRAIVYVTGEEYEALETEQCSPCRMVVVGELVEYSSANVVATIGSADPGAEEIIISAHYDSYRESPGADDNGSGVGVLLELARYFADRGVEPGMRLRLVFYGAEEVGIVGSRVYLDEHLEKLANCAALINLDQVGGAGGPFAEMTGGVSGVPEAGLEDRFPASLGGRAWEGLDGRWRLVAPAVIDLFMATNRPEWFRDLIAESATATGCNLGPSGNMGGDSQVFTQAGILATSIGTSGNTYHGPGDVPEQVVVEQLGVVGNLAAEIACRLMERCSQERVGQE